MIVPALIFLAVPLWPLVVAIRPSRPLFSRWQALYSCLAVALMVVEYFKGRAIRWDGDCDVMTPAALSSARFFAYAAAVSLVLLAIVSLRALLTPPAEWERKSPGLSLALLLYGVGFGFLIFALGSLIGYCDNS